MTNLPRHAGIWNTLLARRKELQISRKQMAEMMSIDYHRLLRIEADSEKARFNEIQLYARVLGFRFVLRQETR